jgi:DNA-binding response OmpR family regulator
MPLCERRRAGYATGDSSAFDEARREVIRQDGTRARIVGRLRWSILALLRARRGRLAANETIGTVIWGDLADPPDELPAQRVHISHLRKALRGSGDRIATVCGSGYRFEREEG